MTYDALGNEIEENYFDEEGKPTRRKDGYAKLSLAYDVRGKEIERAILRPGRKAAANKDGYAKIGEGVRRHEPAGRGSVISTRLDKPTLSKGRLCQSHAGQYDGTGNPAEEAYFDQEGKLTRNKKWIREDRSESMTTMVSSPRRAYFDRLGKPTLSKDGYAKRTLS